MEFEVREAETAQDLDFIAERFEETVSLWEDYAPTPESIATQRERVATWLADPKAHITVAVTPDDQVLGFNSLYLTQDYDGTPWARS